MVNARIYRSGNNIFDCKRTDNGQMIQAIAKGQLLKGDEGPVVGDFVELNFDEQTSQFEVMKIMKRKNGLYRYTPRENRKKITAANIDILVIQSSVSKPVFKRGFIDRFLVRAIEWQVRPIIVFNKMDEYSEKDFDLSFEAQRVEALGVECFEIAAKFPEYKNKYLKNGLSELQKILKNETAIFLGQSGVGKSKVINCLSENEFDVRVNKVGKYGKGNHTTTWSEIYDYGDYTLVDSPGIRSLSLEDHDPKELMSYFPDLCDKAALCQFNNCDHLKNNKRCAFQEDRLSDSLESRLTLSRLEGFLRIYGELLETPLWKKRFKS